MKVASGVAFGAANAYIVVWLGLRIVGTSTPTRSPSGDNGICRAGVKRNFRASNWRRPAQSVAPGCGRMQARIRRMRLQERWLCKPHPKHVETTEMCEGPVDTSDAA